jgi:hypothetical protein
MDFILSSETNNNRELKNPVPRPASLGGRNQPEAGSRGERFKDWDNCNFPQLSQLFLLF